MLVYTLDDGKFWQLINNPYLDDDREDRTITSNSDWLEINLNTVFSGITYNNLTGELTLNFIKTYISGSTYESSGVTVSEILSYSTIIDFSGSTLALLDLSKKFK